MTEIRANLYYAKSHEWVREDTDGDLSVGISDYAQELLGDVVYVELPEPGACLEAGKEIGVIESVKAAADIYAPVGGEVTAVNEALVERPELINQDPYADGWLFRMRPAQQKSREFLDALLDAEGYSEICEELKD